MPLNPLDNPNDKASSNPEHDPSKGATLTDQQSNAAREQAGKPPLDASNASHDFSRAASEGGEKPSEEVAKDQATEHPANPERPTTSPASGQQVSANLVQSTSEVEIEEAVADGKRSGKVTVHFVIQPNDPRSERAIVYAAVQDEYNPLRAAGF